MAQLLLVELRTALTLAAATAAAALGLQDFSAQLGQFGLWQGRQYVERLHIKVVQNMPGVPEQRVTSGLLLAATACPP